MKHIEYLKGLGACRAGLKFAAKHQSLAEVWDACPRGDWMIWLLRRSGRMDKPMAVRIALECAEHVLEKFEQLRPGDNGPRAAIDAARKWLLGSSEENRRAAADAAADAAAAADADAAAYAAAYAAAAAAAYAVGDAAYAAAAAAAAARSNARSNAEPQWQADKIREIMGAIEF